MQDPAITQNEGNLYLLVERSFTLESLDTLHKKKEIAKQAAQYNSISFIQLPLKIVKIFLLFL